LGGFFTFPDIDKPADGIIDRVLSQTFGIFRLLADFATWFSKAMLHGSGAARNAPYPRHSDKAKKRP
jgi:hypothetical protein